ncbi:MAG: cation:proton antiporter [Candidatus Nanohaloarchaea archaeon]|nr:cation:proton antiporter [Candidatus Nanohaloarchaea archaeon]
MAADIVVALAVIYLVTLLLGNELEKIQIPWVFAALILGLVFAFWNPLGSSIHSETFTFLARLGMFFFVFVVGLEIDIGEIRSQSSFLIKTTLIVIAAETILGGLFIHYVFGTGWLVAFYVAHFFATVGEAVLVPILEEFQLFGTELGQAILGVGVVDDFFEILSIFLLPFFLSSTKGGAVMNPFLAVFSLFALFGLTYFLSRMDNESGTGSFGFGTGDMREGALFLFVIFVVLAFVFLGEFVHAGILGALLAGIAVNHFIPSKRLENIEREVKAVTFGFFGPLFFFWVGSDISIVLPEGLTGFWGLPPLLVFILLVLGKVIYVKAAKIGGAIVSAWNRFSIRESIVMGVSLSVKFSTSIVLIKIMFEQGLIEDALYSVLITSKIVFKFIVPFLLSYMIPMWGISSKKD